MFILILCFKLVAQFSSFNYSNLRFTFLSELQYKELFINLIVGIS